MQVECVSQILPPIVNGVKDVEASNNNGQVHAVLDSDLSPGSVFDGGKNAYVES